MSDGIDATTYVKRGAFAFRFDYGAIPRSPINHSGLSFMNVYASADMCSMN